jgi:uncharacterized membrane protein
MAKTMFLWMHLGGRLKDRIAFDRYYYVGLALLAIVMTLLIIKLYREWWDIHDVEEPDSPEDLLRSFERVHACGEIDDQELERVRQRLGQNSAASSARPQFPTLDEDGVQPAPGDSARPPSETSP